MRTILLILYTVYAYSLYAQVNIDSLRSVAFDLGYSDTVRTRALNNLAFNGFIYTEPDSAYHYAQLSYNLAESFDYTLGMGDATKTQGDSYLVRAKYNEAIPYYEKSLALFEEISHDAGVAAVLNNLGSTHRVLGDLEKAIQAFDKSLRINEKLGRDETVSATLFNIGSMYDILKNYPKAKEYYLRSIDYSEKPDGNKRNLALALMNVSTIVIEDDRQIAEDYLKRALDAANEFGDKAIVADCYIKYGDYYKDTDKSKAMSYYHNAVKITDTNIASAALANIANIQHEERKYKDALANYLKSFDNIEEFESRSRISRNIYSCYKNLGQPQKALEYLELHKELSDSLLQASHVESFNDVQTKYETEKKEIDNQNLRTKNELVSKQRNMYMIGAIGLLGLLSLLGFLFTSLRSTKKKLDDQNIELKNLNDTKDKFFGIIAHDLRSPLIALGGVDMLIDSYVEKNNMDKLKSVGGQVKKTASRLTGLLDSLLSWATLQQGFVPYNPEIIDLKSLVDNIIDMYKGNASLKNIELINSIKSEESIYADKTAVNTVIRNLIGNAIKFTQDSGVIKLTSSDKNNKVEIAVIDNGVGMEETEIKDIFSLDKRSTDGTNGEVGNGIGLNIVKELLELNKGDVSVESTKGHGTTFYLTLPKANT